LETAKYKAVCNPGYYLFGYSKYLWEFPAYHQLKSILQLPNRCK